MTRARAWVLRLGIGLLTLELSFAAWATDPPHPDASCGSCHVVHHASYPTLLGQLCESCHFEGGPATAVVTHSSRTTDAGYGNWDLDCWACHDPHTQHQDRTWGTTYGKYLRVDLRAQVKEIDPGAPGPYYPPLSILRTVTGTNIRFTSPAEFVDGDLSTNDDICQACHQSTAYYNTGPQANTHADYGTDSQPGGNCVSCHPHGGGFSPAGGGCTGCHGSTQPPGAAYRRQVAGAGGDFQRTSHHVTDGTTTEVVTNADCEVCHQQVNHQSNTDPQVLLNDPDLGAAVTHTYDETGASLTTFCIRCHDADSSVAYDADGNPGDGKQPFSDGRAPPDVASVWSGSTHQAVLTAQGCLSCHGGADSTRTGLAYAQNVHGSSFPRLLSPLVAGQAVSNPEEALCFACHDGDPASNQQPSFAGTSWVTLVVGEALNLNLNSHHDIYDADQAQSGAKIECVNCHDPHAVTAGQKVRLDPDPSDGRIPAAGQTWTGSDYLSEWCLDCHDGSLPPSVTPPSTPLADVRTTHLTDSHGGGSGNASLKSGYGWAAGDVLPCTACHVSGHGSSNLFQLRTTVMSKDGTTPIPSDCASYEVADNGVKTPEVNGYCWCNTCHTGSMGDKKDNCFDCHFHGIRF